MSTSIRGIGAFFIAAALLVGAGLHSAAADPVINRWSGQYATVTEPRTIVATSESDWQAMLALTGAAPSIAIAFDGVHQSGVGIFLGRRGTGGYDVQIVSMGPRGDKFIIVIDEQRPGDGGMVTQSLTSPWSVLLIERPELPIEIEPRFHALN